MTVTPAGAATCTPCAAKPSPAPSRPSPPSPPSPPRAPTPAAAEQAPGSGVGRGPGRPPPGDGATDAAPVRCVRWVGGATAGSRRGSGAARDGGYTTPAPSTCSPTNRRPGPPAASAERPPWMRSASPTRPSNRCTVPGRQRSTRARRRTRAARSRVSMAARPCPLMKVTPVRSTRTSVAPAAHTRPTTASTTAFASWSNSPTKVSRACPGGRAPPGPRTRSSRVRPLMS